MQTRLIGGPRHGSPIGVEQKLPFLSVMSTNGEGDRYELRRVARIDASGATQYREFYVWNALPKEDVFGAAQAFWKEGFELDDN